MSYRNVLCHGSCPHGVLYSRPRSPRARLIDPYTTYLAERWYQGCHNGSQLEEEVRARGYTGSQRGIYRYLAVLEPSAFPDVSRHAAAPPTQVAPSSRPIRAFRSLRSRPPGSFSAGEPT